MFCVAGVGDIGLVDGSRCDVVAVLVIVVCVVDILIIVGLVKVYRGAVVVFVAVFLVIFVVDVGVIAVLSCHSSVVAKRWLFSASVILVGGVGDGHFGVIVVVFVFTVVGGE